MAGEPSWRGQLRSTLHSGDADDVETRVLGCVEELLTKEAEKQRSRAQFQQGILDKKMASLRSAAELEGQHMATKLQESHRKALAKLHDELVEMQADYEAKINEQAAFEEQLKQKISELGGADAAMALERERYIKHLGKSAVKRMLNAALTTGWQTWKGQWAELQKIKQASFRLRSRDRPELVRVVGAPRRGEGAEAHAQRRGQPPDETQARRGLRALEGRLRQEQQGRAEAEARGRTEGSGGGDQGAGAAEGDAGQGREGGCQA